MTNEVFDQSILLKDNALLKHRPELFDEWDFEKNTDLNIYVVTKGSKKRAWWRCLECKSSYYMRIGHRVNGSKCSYCKGQKVNQTNSLANCRPHIAREWHPTKNKNLTPHAVSIGSDQIVWWQCHVCSSGYTSTVGNRTRGRGCPYCSSTTVNETNSLFALCPRRTEEWHPTKNGDLTPHDVMPSSNKKVWWLGKCGHEWEASINSRKESACPYCSNRKTLKGFNDMWTTNPELASMLADPEDGYRYTQKSNKKVDWKCNTCKYLINNKVISSICTVGMSCPRCSDSIPFGEKFIYHLLKESKIKFTYDESQTWSQGKRYDFYLPEHNWIIEVHGEQHFVQTNRKGARSLEEEKENDLFKKNLALQNDIANYVVIDASSSLFPQFKEEILNSQITMIAKEVDLTKILSLSANSFVKIACDLWKQGMRSTRQISKEMKISQTTIARYLAIGAEIGWCNYNPKKVMYHNGKISSQKRKKPVLQLTIDGEIIKQWDSATDASKGLSISQSGIYSVCAGKRKTAGGFKWVYRSNK